MGLGVAWAAARPDADRRRALPLLGRPAAYGRLSGEYHCLHVQGAGKHKWYLFEMREVDEVFQRDCRNFTIIVKGILFHFKMAGDYTNNL